MRGAPRLGWGASRLVETHASPGSAMHTKTASSPFRQEEMQPDRPLRSSRSHETKSHGLGTASSGIGGVWRGGGVQEHVWATLNVPLDAPLGSEGPIQHDMPGLLHPYVALTSARKIFRPGVEKQNRALWGEKEASWIQGGLCVSAALGPENRTSAGRQQLGRRWRGAEPCSLSCRHAEKQTCAHTESAMKSITKHNYKYTVTHRNTARC